MEGGKEDGEVCVVAVSEQCMNRFMFCEHQFPCCLYVPIVN